MRDQATKRVSEARSDYQECRYCSTSLSDRRLYKRLRRRAQRRLDKAEIAEWLAPEPDLVEDEGAFWDWPIPLTPERRHRALVYRLPDRLFR